MHRFFVPPQKVRGSTITLDDPRELHHLRDVLRLGVGDRVVCFDGRGMEYAGVISDETPSTILIHIDRPARHNRQTVSIWLAQGLPKADRFDWIVQKATELGVVRLSPLITRHSVLRLNPEQARRKLTRWQRIAQEAAKQCGRTTIPSIDPPQTLQTCLPELERLSLVLMPTLAVTAVSLNEVLNAHSASRDVGILIGPEGDFAREEVTLAERYGARPVSLGSLTLRSETAALATLAIVSYALGS